MVMKTVELAGAQATAAEPKDKGVAASASVLTKGC